LQIENYSTNPNSSILNLDNLDSISEKGEIDIISNEPKKYTNKNGKSNIISEKKSEDKGEYYNNLIQKKSNPKIQKRLNLLSSLDNYDSFNNNICLTEGNNCDVDKEYAKNKKLEIKEYISKKINGNNSHKIRKMMDQSSSLFDNKFYESNCTGK